MLDDDRGDVGARPRLGERNREIGEGVEAPLSLLRQVGELAVVRPLAPPCRPQEGAGGESDEDAARERDDSAGPRLCAARHEETRLFGTNGPTVGTKRVARALVERREPRARLVSPPGTAERDERIEGGDHRVGVTRRDCHVPKLRRAVRDERSQGLLLAPRPADRVVVGRRRAIVALGEIRARAGLRVHERPAPLIRLLADLEGVIDRLDRRGVRSQRESEKGDDEREPHGAGEEEPPRGLPLRGEAVHPMNITAVREVVGKTAQLKRDVPFAPVRYVESLTG